MEKALPIRDRNSQLTNALETTTDTTSRVTEWENLLYKIIGARPHSLRYIPLLFSIDNQTFWETNTQFNIA